MPAASKHRRALLETAIRLFRQQGYAGTGLNQILAESGAPKGSLYHYFPAGKAAIGAAAVRAAGKGAAATLQQLAAGSTNAGVLVKRYCRLVEGWMAKSGFRDGSPIATTLLEMAPENEAIRQAGAEAFAAWAGVLEARLLQDGIAPARARRLAQLAIAAIEGALLQVRVERSGKPLADAAAELAAMFAQAVEAQGAQTGRRRRLPAA